jgi:hypothetical protein
MSYESLLELHLSQCEIFLKKSQTNSYSDKDKTEYQANLFELFEKIKSSIPADLDEISIFEIQEHLNFITKSLEFLMDSTLNTIPFEVVSCLNLALKDWIDDEEFIITTSLNNDIDSYSFDDTLAVNDLLYNSLSAAYNISFKKRLIEINLPSILVKDYFSSVILYHELGHFIDIYYHISEKISLNLIEDPVKWTSVQNFLPFIGNKSNLEKTKYHIGEYFCDLFAAQYIGTTATNYLSYLEIKTSHKLKLTHPSTKNRTDVVNDFLKRKTNPVVNLIRGYTETLTQGRKLRNRHTKLNEDDFYRFLPLVVDEPKQLHGVFPYAWKIWMGGTDQFRKNAELKIDLPPQAIYKALNNLIEKTIGNYIIKRDWEKVK